MCFHILDIDSGTAFNHENCDDPVHLGLGEPTGVMLYVCCWASCNLTN